jgi:hypothetical protein
MKLVSRVYPTRPLTGTSRALLCRGAP